MGGGKRAVYKVKHELLRWSVKKANWTIGVNSCQKSPKVIVSLTSYPKRFSQIDLCLKSLCLQTVKPNCIILWLGSDSRKSDVNIIKEGFSKYGIEVRWDNSKNLFSHKKYYYAMQEFPDDIVVTADDDLIYPRDWLASLLVSYKQNPDCISARRVHRITWRKDGNPEPYTKWEGEVRTEEPSHNLIATTGAGVLFPPMCFDEECYKSDVFLNNAKTADDIWLKVMAIISNRRVVWAKNEMPMPTTIDLKQEEKLEMINCEGGGNDKIFEQLFKHYNLSKNNFMN